MSRSFAHFINPWFIGCSLVFVIHQVCQWILGFRFPWLDAYLDPLLMMPIRLHIVLWERRYCFGWGAAYTLSRGTIFSYFLLVSVLAEVIFPALQPKFVGDWLDVLAYAVGAILYSRLMNTTQRS